MTVDTHLTALRLLGPPPPLGSHVGANMFAGQPLDVITGKQPVLIETYCNQSAMLVEGVGSGTWGVCTGD